MPLPEIATGKRLVITLEPNAGIVLRDESGRDIATIIVNDRYLKRTRLVFQVAESINIRRETKGYIHIHEADT